MNIAMKSSLATLAAAAAFAAANAGAVSQIYMNDANAPAHCQAFTPGPTNTVRNRVTGSENIGAAMNVACAFENVSSLESGSPTIAVGLQVGNNGNYPFTVTCSELSGYFGDAGMVITKTTESINPGSSTYVDFDSDDTPDEEDTDLGSYSAGIVCNLPSYAVMSETYALWADEDGVEAE
jgi:hypothetical protein